MKTNKDRPNPVATYRLQLGADCGAHDGFTLRDLVTYHDKHNEANGEDNNDGENNNRSWNCGVEGPTDDEAINAHEENWEDPTTRSIGVFLNGDAIPSPDAQGRPVRDDSFLVLNNAWWEPLEWVLPGPPLGGRWELVVDSATSWVAPSADQRADLPPVQASVPVAGRSLVVLRRIPEPPIP